MSDADANEAIDILLHHSGHIMLSDFDLAKQGGRAATIMQSEVNGVRGICSAYHPALTEASF
jgi:hypothetical protein